jgi:hypothetical protein
VSLNKSNIFTPFDFSSDFVYIFAEMYILLQIVFRDPDLFMFITSLFMFITSKLLYLLSSRKGKEQQQHFMDIAAAEATQLHNYENTHQV